MMSPSPPPASGAPQNPEAPQFFRCDRCQMPFESLFEDSNQAFGCSCDCFGESASAHYGSSFDMESFIRPPNAKPAPAGDLCDACLFNALAEGSLAPLAGEITFDQALRSPATRARAIALYQAWLLGYSRELAALRTGADPS